MSTPNLQGLRNQLGVRETHRKGQWIKCNKLYRLLNIHGVVENNLAFCRRKRKGVNLEWRSTELNVMFLSESGQSNIFYDEPFCLQFFDSLGFLEVQKQFFNTVTLAVHNQSRGINLGWYPNYSIRYEWAFHGQWPGEPVKIHDIFSLRNLALSFSTTQPNAFLVYTHQDGDVINLGWSPTASPEWKLSKKSEEFPYIGSDRRIGGGVCDDPCFL